MTVMVSAADLAAPLLTPEGIQDPYPIYRRIRASSPVYWSAALRSWVVTGYEQVREVYRDHERFASGRKYAGQLEALPSAIRAQVPTLELVQRTPAMGLADPPVHTRQRQRVNPSLTPRQLSKKREWIQELCAELADEMSRQDEPDLVEHFARPLSYRSILGLFGAPLDHVPIYEEATRTLQVYRAMGGSNVDAALRHERATAALKDAIESMYEVVLARDDPSILGSLLRSVDLTKEADRNEVFAIARLFFSGGQENLAYTIPTAIHELLRNPAELAKLKADPTLAGAAYEEAVRYDEPNQNNPRDAIVDTEIAGAHVRTGDHLLNFKAAANRDPDAYTDPDRFDITRDQNEPEGGSVAFGQGIHFCVGAGIARLEGPIAIVTLLERFPNMRLPHGWRPHWAEVPASRKLSALPLVLS